MPGEVLRLLLLAALLGAMACTAVLAGLSFFTANRRARRLLCGLLAGECLIALGGYLAVTWPAETVAHAARALDRPTLAQVDGLRREIAARQDSAAAAEASLAELQAALRETKTRNREGETAITDLKIELLLVQRESTERWRDIQEIQRSFSVPNDDVSEAP
jgi:septal ring factor EnvC (AmiA/AmiB activator)